MRFRAGIRILLVLALVLFALVVGIGSAVIEIATLTRVEVDAAVNRAELAGHIVLSQLAITLRDSTRTFTEAMRHDERLASVISDAQQLTPSVLYIMVADTLDQVLVHSEPDFQGRRAQARPRLVRRDGIRANLGQFSDIIDEPGAYEVAIPLLLDGRDFAEVRVGLEAAFLRNELMLVFPTHMAKIVAQILLAMLLGSLVSWLLVLRPLARIEKGIRHLQKGDFTHRLPVLPGNEFGELAGQINALSEILARDQEQFATQRESLVSEGNALRSIVDAVDDGLFMVDRERHITMANRKASAFLGSDLSSMTGKPLSAALPRNHPLVRLVEKSFLDNRPESAQLEFRTPSGSRVFLATCQVVGESPNQQGGIVSLREFGRIKEIQEMLDHARVLSRLGKMAAGVAHEVRNPLHSIGIHLELMRTKLEMAGNGVHGQEKLQEHIAVVSREISKLERVVTGFLNLTRLQELRFAAIDVKFLFDGLRKLVLPEARMAGVEIVVQVEENLPHIYGDEALLREALLNLLKNAIQASPSGADPIRLCAEADGDMVLLVVEDRGQGIPVDVQDKVFDLYYTTKKEGTGVGLSQAQQAIEMHGGTISFSSSRETGTTFRIRLPALAVV